MRVDQVESRSVRAPLLAAGALLLLALLAACTQTANLSKGESFQRPPGTVSVLLMPADIELYELLASGLQEPRAEWTAAAKRNVDAAVGDMLHPQNAELVPYVPPANDLAAERRHTQLLKLHDAVGGSILLYQYGGISQLPGKAGHFDWTLGSGASELQRTYGADYALFIYLRDSYSSSGRKALMVGMALLGIGVPGGTQVGYASLVELRTGDFVWFNYLYSTVGDLRTPKPAHDAVRELLSGQPL